MINQIIFEKLTSQTEELKQKLIRPLSEQYAELLAMCKEGTVRFKTDDLEALLAEIKSRSRDKSEDSVFAKFLRKTILDQNAAVDSLKNSLQSLLAQVRNDDMFQESGAMIIEYDWYYHYNSSVTLLHRRGKYPVITEPRYLNELDPSLYTKYYEGPNFSSIWPDCSEVEEKAELLGMGSAIMNYYQSYSRLFLHIALREMHEKGELEMIENLPFIFYINEHDCEVMSLFVKEN